MYQPLIWSAVLRDDARGLRAALDPQDLKCLADALVDSVRRDVERRRDLLGREMLVDEAQAVELALRQACDTLRHRIVIGRAAISVGGVRQTRRLLQSKSDRARHYAALPSNESGETLWQIPPLGQFSADFRQF